MAADDAPSLRLRLATKDDVPRCSSIAIAAYKDDECQDFFFPHRNEPKYAPSYRQHWLRGLRNDFLAPGSIYWVVETVTEKPEVVAFCVFQWDYWQQGKGRKPVGLNLEKDSLWERLQRTFYTCYDKLYLKIHPCIAMDMSAVATYPAAREKEIHDCWSGEWKIIWRVSHIITAPEWQGHGAGTMLMQWIYGQQEKDGVVVGLESVKAADGFYRKVGMEIVGLLECRPPDQVWNIFIKKPVSK